ncbi:hypothetical protein MO867_18615 [Microbulbifer sp. OS29]|uniref:Uncharacterized protein n=1 Tax=Microbulbifer okhotskensis TaxID=2926617 RepID=A0A9X2EQ14_9GAMM|nr:hypothetical protein [Microbulbifer okhotskensis]MCO1336349.1 hypothetical protein [Microbulbifer okhotskensis]
MGLLINKKLLALSLAALLAACGGGGGSSSSDSDTSSTDNGSGQGSSGGQGSSDDDTPISDNVGTTVTVGDVEVTNLGFASLTAVDLTLPEAMNNAREVYQMAHYIARTDGEQDQEDIDIPIRSYTATCATDTETPRMFVSTSLSEGSSAADTTYGSVYELQYDPSTSSFEPTGNATLLRQCSESHGIAASADCSTVAVLCNTDYQASERYDVQGDLVEQYGSTWMKMEDNIDTIESRITNEIGLLVATNHSKYINFFTGHATLTFDDFLAGLEATFPDTDFGDSPSFTTIKGAEMQEEMEYIISNLSSGNYDDLLQHIRDVSYKYNEQIWLLEWENQTLSEVPDAYVVNKMHGGTHLGAQELSYVEEDSQDRSSYGFSVSARVFDGYGNSHYSAGLTVIDRDNWSLDMSSSDNRGWYWACGDGHVVNIRSFYNPDSELYGAICTSDWNDWIGSTHGQLGTIAIKMEASSSSTEGRFNHFVPSTSVMVSNGGGHTVVPVDADTNLSLIVAPKYIETADMDRFLQDEVGVDSSGSGPFDEDCADYDSTNCFLSYMSYNYWEDDDSFPTISRQGLYSGDALEPNSLTRIGIAKVSASGSMEGQGFNWVVEDNDCQISDPQLVDLKNGRYLLGYAKFQCISDNLSFDRIYANRGSKRLLVPKAFYIMEIDADMNVLEGPIELPNYGWGGLDEPMYMGDGKVAWTYIKNPTYDSYGGGQQNVWQAMIYHSNSAN